MAFQYYNRYNQFLINGQQTVVPYINLPAKTTDKNFKTGYFASPSHYKLCMEKLALLNESEVKTLLLQNQQIQSIISK